MAEIIAALEGTPSPSPSASASRADCSHEPLCPVRSNWQRINEAVRAALMGISLSEMARSRPAGPQGLVRLGQRHRARGFYARRPSRGLTAPGSPGPVFQRNAEETMQNADRDPSSTSRTQDYKFGFITDVEQDIFPPGLSEDVIRALSAKKEEPEWMLEWRLKAYRLWLDMAEPTWANVHYSPHRLPIDRLLRGTQAQGLGAEESRRGGPGDPRHLRKAGHSAAGAGDARRRGRGRGVRQRLRGHHLQGQARRGRHHLLLVLGGGAQPSGSRQALSRLGGALLGQLLRHAQLGGVLGRLVRLTCRRVCAARWSSPPISASTPSIPGSSSAR